ncbi:hypothetical protein LSTR_LSTR012449 [Laodelphax striatellus]|uniref:Uncharacterized protein n=1 Tax=Laodelphax striatellus TaxID=195883 RepID=A0A482XKP3_LAOST|nr:hypothetical protein LSTR_LSTR012449 [Laodelphax striatellus]
MLGFRGREETLELDLWSWPMVRYKREVLFGWVDLLAGLFLGFSLVSGIEIIYYFTIRAACMVNDDDVTPAAPQPPPVAPKGRRAAPKKQRATNSNNIFWLNDQLMMKQQMALNMNNMNNRNLRVKHNNYDNSLYSIPYLN